MAARAAPTRSPSTRSDVIAPADTCRYVAMQLAILINERELRPAEKHGLGPA